MKTAIIILNWNGQKLLEQFLPSIVNFSLNQADIYVADNASTDDSIAYVKRVFPSVKIIENAVNGGYAKGYNDALQSVDADIYCLINSDVEVTKNWLTPILDIFRSDKNTAIIQPKILDFKDKTKFEYAGAGGGFIDLYGYPYCRGRVFNYLEKDSKQFDDISDIFWASGACFFIRSKVYHQIHGFDEKKRRTEQAQALDVIISQGARPPSAKVKKISRCFNDRLKLKSAVYPLEVAELGGTKTILNSITLPKNEFFHIELSYSLRKKLIQQPKLMSGLKKCISL